MTASESLRQLLLSILTDWRFQYGRWTDAGNTFRYAVLRPVGGMPAGLVRQPAFTLVLIGSLKDPLTAAEAKAQEVITHLLDESGSLVFAETGEPVCWSTDDGRPVAELAINTIINR